MSMELLWTYRTPTQHTTLLPHKSLLLKEHFPTAAACPALPEVKVVEDMVLEDEGKRIGIGMNSEEMQRWKDSGRRIGRRTRQGVAREVGKEAV